MDKVFVKQLPLGDMENFTYIVADKASGDALVIDPSGPMTAVLRELKAEGLTLKGILLTHGHYDHVVDVDKADVPVYLSAAEAFFYTPKMKHPVRTRDDEEIALGAFRIRCLHTPGHTPGCQCFLVDGNLFTGDTLFIDAVGRTDLPGGSAKILFKSLQRIKELPDTAIVWPGHHYGAVPCAPLGDLKQSNPFLVTASLGTFEGYLG